MGQNQALGMPASTPGTKAAIWTNAIGTVLTAAGGFSGVIPPQYSMYLAIAAMLGNTLLHGFTGTQEVPPPK